MKCHVCGGLMESATTDLPFKISSTSIVVVRQLPVIQCTQCSEFLIADAVMAKVEEVLKQSRGQELVVVRYAA